ncbi:thiopeptide-type bacteriocin biosynthesis protein [Streptomyces kanasensis]|uniref:thiopeptide-type bacteriocin biosynthesis protein n=1 Tax=Streptomyces kanasensis TaxID=936756 RepID=UPI0036FFCAAE
MDGFPAPALPADGLPDFLRRVADLLETDTADAGPEFTRTARRFLDAGRAAACAPEPVRWLEYRLRAPAAMGGLLGRLARFAGDRLDADAADDFFFVRKGPVLRVRFHCGPGRQEELDRVAVTEWRRLCRQGHAESWGRAFYEPEAHLFGGDRSMAYVHRIFTADSLFWARHHASPDGPAPAWAASLVMIRALFDALGIVGWEDGNVWEVLRRRAGRTFGVTVPDGWQRTASGVRDAWSGPGGPARLLDERTLARIEEFRSAVAAPCARWHEEYFGTRHAVVGPREAAAFLIVFHWNRAGLPMSWQTAITEALGTAWGDGR